MEADLDESVEKPDTNRSKREQILDACRAVRDRTCGVAYSPINILPELDDPGADNVKEKRRDIIRDCIDHLDKQHRNGIKSPFLRVTEGGLDLETGSWVTFVDEASSCLDDARLIAQCVEDLTIPGANPRWKRKTYFFELYFLLYLIRKELYPSSPGELLGRARSLTNCRKIKDFVLAAPWGKFSPLVQLPEIVREKPLQVLDNLQIAIESQGLDSEDKFLMCANWPMDYAQRILGSPQKNFIDLETRLVSQREGFKVSQQAQRDSGTPVRLLTAVQQERWIVLLGSSGAGKSWILKRAAKEWLERKNGIASTNYLPVLVELQDFNLTPDVYDLVSSSICEFIGNEYRTEVAKWLDSESAKAEDVLLLLDGYNEILPTHRQKFKRLFQQFVGSRNNRVIITTRAHDSELLFPEWPRVSIKSVSAVQVRQYMIDRLGDESNSVYAQIKASSQLLTLAESPFFLDALVRCVQDRGTKDIPTSRASLIEAVVAMALERKIGYESVQLDTHPGHGELTTFLAAVAHRMLALREREVVHPHDTKPLWADSMIGVQKVLEFSELVGVLASSGTALAGKCADQVRFAHDLLRDYFAAKYLYKMLIDNEPAFLTALPSIYLESSVWDEAILMLADLCESEAKCAQVIDTIIRHDVFLAAEFVSRLSTVGKNRLIGVARLAESFEGKTELLPARRGRPHEPAAKLLEKLPTDVLYTLYHKTPLRSCAWSSVVLAHVFKGGEVWRNLLHIPEGCTREAVSMILIAISRVPSFQALHELLSVTKAWLESMSDEVRGVYKSCVPVIIGDNSFGLSANQLLDMLHDASDEDTRYFLSALLPNVELSPSHLARLEEFASGTRGITCSQVIRSLADVKPSHAIPYLEPRFLKEHDVSPYLILDVLRTVARWGENLSAMSVVQTLISDPSTTQYELSDLLDLLVEFDPLSARYLVLRRISDSDAYVPPSWFRSYLGDKEFHEALRLHEIGASPDVRARINIARSVAGNMDLQKELAKIVELGLTFSVQEWVEKALAKIEREYSKVPEENGGDEEVQFTIDTIKMALKAVAIMNMQALAPQIWKLIKDKPFDGIKAAAVDALVALKYFPVVLFYLSTKDSSSTVDYTAYKTVTELMGGVQEVKRRRILFDLKDYVAGLADVDSEWKVHLTCIAQAILRDCGKRFINDLDGWPFGTATFSQYGEATGYGELDALIREHG
jgi:hypothetical protein